MRYRPWVVVYCEYFEHKSESINRENELKSASGRRWIHNNMTEMRAPFV